MGKVRVFSAIIVLILIMIFFVIAVLNGEKEYNSVINSPMKGKVVNDFRFKTMFFESKESPILELQEIKEEIFLIVFVARNCIICIKDGTTLLELQNNKQVPIYLVFWQDAQQKEILLWLQKYHQTNKYSFKNYKAIAYDDGKYSINFGVSGVPEIFIMNNNGQIFEHFKGEITENVYNKILEYFNPK